MLPWRLFECLFVYSHEYSLDLDKISLLKKCTKLPTRILVPKSFKCTPYFHKCVLEILSLEIKTNLINTHCSLELLFTCLIRRINAMLFLGKIDDIITSFTPRLMQDLPMVKKFSFSFTVFIFSFV